MDQAASIKILVILCVFQTAIPTTSQTPIRSSSNHQPTGPGLCFLQNGEVLPAGEHKNSTVTGCRLIMCSEFGFVRIDECPTNSCSRTAVSGTLIGYEQLYPDCCSRIACPDSDFFFTETKGNQID
ncbi:uncharacterized protein LOC105692832 isoform X1 [Athalia rosae]|uniref:uncharacterized protein LOC105692832 isoform X1 n=1 Tax=Athalia rosae TaxID=37344 RepID=UPI00203329E2|nr:uncharacterized protein LOC105692832 isoform X1 [Athalia rosae]